MRKLYMGLCFVLLVSRADAAPHGTHATAKAHFGCTSKDEYEGLLLMAAGGQTTAFQAELVKAAAADKCTTFAAGEKVTVLFTETGEPDPLLGGKRLTLSKIRFEGRGSQAWWTSPSAIK